MLSKSNAPSQSVVPETIVTLTGMVLVWYGYYLFGSLASIISPQFFPKSLTEITGPAYTYTFVLAFVVRPLGGLLFGWLADWRGRRFALALSLLLAGLSTFLIGVLPSFNSIKTVAPIALLGLRTVESLSFGGAVVVAIIYIFELAPPKRHGLYTSLLQIAPALGLALSLASIVATRRIFGNQFLLVSGWRYPLLLSILLVGLAIYLRVRLSESPAFRKTEEPVTRGANWTRMLTLVFAIVAGQVSLFFLSQFYAAFHLQNVLRIETWTASLIVCGANLLGIPFVILFGALSDRFERKKIILLSCLLSALICLPIYSLMRRAAGVSVTRIAMAVDPITGRFGPHPVTSVQNRFEPVGPAANPNVPLLVILVFLLVFFSAAVAGPMPAYLAENFAPERRGLFVAGTYVGHGVLGGLLPLVSMPLLVSSGNIYAGVYVAAALALSAVVAGALFLRQRTPA